ncbi:hypothetical protein BC332_16602 [Capsicum chinense]|nr:hypothetical protein BC332_16602 [Capsicum chinense]
MMNNPTFSLVILFLLSIFTCLCEITTKADNADAKFYVVYLGHKPHNDHELITNSHHELLGQVAGSKEEAKKLMVYSYRHGFSGFAAKLTDSQAKQIGELPDVVQVIPNQFYKTHTSTSWDFLGLSKHDPNSLVNKTNQGDGIIIGIIDSDDDGHGTHVAYTTAGSYINNVEYHGVNMGTTRGGAPLARLAIYKVAWNGINGEMISNIDVLAAIDDAIKDGVDDLFISFIASGGNSGPTSYTVGATSPWVISVASSSFNRENNKTIRASGLIKGKGHGFAPLVTLANVTKVEDIKSIASGLKEKVLLLFFQKEDDADMSVMHLKKTALLGYICATLPADQLNGFNQISQNNMSFFMVDFEQGNQIFDYIQHCISNNQDPIIKYGQTKILKGKETYITVPRFSSRRPNSFAPEILKPDIVAPAGGYNGFKLASGTSMSAPHVAGIVALLKAAHPNWSPAAIKSALMTTAWNEDTYKAEIFSEGTGGDFADPFDFGGGICNPNGAADPGLIYDMEKNDYSNYLCSLGYSYDRVYNVTTYYSDKKNSTSSAGIVCPKVVPSRLDMNLPSISIPNLKDSVTIKRTVTNVGNVNSIYKLVVKPPRNVAIKVTPDVLKFNAKTKKISFKVKITSTYKRSGKFTFGSLAWSDGKHFVRIPIAVRKQVDE